MHPIVIIKYLLQVNRRQAHIRGDVRCGEYRRASQNTGEKESEIAQRETISIKDDQGKLCGVSAAQYHRGTTY